MKKRYLINLLMMIMLVSCGETIIDAPSDSDIMDTPLIAKNGEEAIKEIQNRDLKVKGTISKYHEYLKTGETSNVVTREVDLHYGKDITRVNQNYFYIENSELYKIYLSNDLEIESKIFKEKDYRYFSNPFLGIEPNSFKENEELGELIFQLQAFGDSRNFVSNFINLYFVEDSLGTIPTYDKEEYFVIKCNNDGVYRIDSCYFKFRILNYMSDFYGCNIWYTFNLNFEYQGFTSLKRESAFKDYRQLIYKDVIKMMDEVERLSYGLLISVRENISSTTYLYNNYYVYLSNEFFYFYNIETKENLVLVNILDMAFEVIINDDSNREINTNPYLYNEKVLLFSEILPYLPSFALLSDYCDYYVLADGVSSQHRYDPSQNNLNYSETNVMFANYFRALYPLAYQDSRFDELDEAKSNYGARCLLTYDYLGDDLLKSIEMDFGNYVYTLNKTSKAIDATYLPTFLR